MCEQSFSAGVMSESAEYGVVPKTICHSGNQGKDSTTCHKSISPFSQYHLNWTINTSASL